MTRLQRAGIYMVMCSIWALMLGGVNIWSLLLSIALLVGGGLLLILGERDFLGAELLPRTV